MIDALEYRELKNEDRCDRCPAQAFVRVTKSIEGNNLELLFCGHHFKSNGNQLGFSGWFIQDETSKINA